MRHPVGDAGLSVAAAKGDLPDPVASPTVKSENAGSSEAAARSQKIRPRRVDTARGTLQLGWVGNRQN